MAQCSKIIRFRCFASLVTNLLNKSVKRHKSEQNVFRTPEINKSDSASLENNAVKKIPKYVKIAGLNEVNVNECLTKPQSQEEVENMFREIAQGDAEIEKQLRLILYEVMIKREEEDQVPNIIRKKHWEELLMLPTLSRRLKYLAFLYKTEKKKESCKIKDALRKKDCGILEGLFKEFPHIYYGLGGYSMFMRIYPQTLSPLQDIRALSNKLFAPPILFDCSYQKYMNNTNTKNCARQISLSVQLNKAHQYPCTLQLVNLKKDCTLMEYLKLSMHNLEEHTMPFETYESSYLDLHPKERLVYLTPHTSYNLHEFSPDDIYIIGAFVDKGNGIQASLAKAKEEGLKMAKLPLDKYLLWKQGTKSLTLNNVLNILLDMRFYKSWEKALKSVPRRNTRY